ncbi:MAG: DUF3987 domain-containing protein [Thiolinea sp.]
MAEIVEFSPAQQPDYPPIQNIVGEVSAKPYPMDDLPDLFRAAANEAQSIIKSPYPMLACSAIAAASIAVQGLVKVRALKKLVMPVGLMMLVEAESGERKSSGEKLFMPFAEKWVAEQLALLEQKQADYEADAAAWKAQIKGCEMRLQKQVKDAPEDTAARDAIRQELRQLYSEEPKKPPIPRIRHSDITVEALVKSLKNFPVIGILTAEGAQFFGSVAFQNGNGSNFMAKCNSAYSDEAIDVSRSGDGSAMLNNIALTLSVSVQPQVFQEWCKKQGSTAWDSGFLPRVLMAAPDTTQGTRLLGSIEEENNTMLETPALDEFNQRAYELLAMLPEQMTKEGNLNRKLLDMSEEALAYWVEFYNHIETSLAPGGYSEFIRSAAARAAENAARLAAIFHVFENGLEGEIEERHVVSACNIVKWHLSETKRFRYRLELPEHYVHAGNVAKRIARFVRERKLSGVAGWQEVTERHIITRLSPKAVQDSKTVKPVIMELLDAGHLLEWQHDAPRPYVVVNPRIVEAGL